MINVVVADAPSWTDTGGFWIALAGAAFGLAGFGVAIWSARSGQRSAKAAEDAALDSRRAADAAELSARAAEMSADADHRLAELEIAREHDGLRPRFTGRWEFEKSGIGDGSWYLAYRFKLDRDYTVKAVAWTMNRTSYTDVSVTEPTAPGGDWTLWVEQWSPDRKDSEYRELEIKFWPPRTQSGRAAPWACRCDGPGVDDGTPHWDVVVRVEPPQAPKMRMLV